MCKFRMKARDLHRLSGKLVNVRNCCFSDARPHASSTHGRFTMPVTLNRMQHCRCASSSNSSSASLLHSESLVLHFQMIFLTTKYKLRLPTPGFHARMLIALLFATAMWPQYVNRLSSKQQEGLHRQTTDSCGRTRWLLSIAPLLGASLDCVSNRAGQLK